MLSAKTIITRYSGASGAQYDYTWTADDRQAVTDMVNLYDLLVAASPEDPRAGTERANNGTLVVACHYLVDDYVF